MNPPDAPSVNPAHTPHLLIMAAGTGGHVMPGLAVAKLMQSRGWRVSWLGTEHGMENRLVPPSGVPLTRLPFTGLRGKGLGHAWRGFFALLSALLACRRLLREQEVDVVLGMGGYVCLPGGWAAALTRKPMVLMNADASLLLSNRLLAPLASRMAVGFDGAAAAHSGSSRRVVTGNPVRADIHTLPPPAQRLLGRRGPLRVLVLGGSLGAQALNQNLPQALALLTPAMRPEVVHQCGTAHEASVRALYAQLDVQAHIRPFIDDVATALADCDVVVCRAGAITVSELCAAGVASILVPLVVSTTAHQRDNAQWMAQHGAAIHLPQAELAPKLLADTLAALSRERLLAMANSARALARPDATERVADLIQQVLPSVHPLRPTRPAV
jgi:UDP-N-acetylglucosamine--N-acetylmuramyl-(pentapeptide) pyrophosphoryl-undecaprenol N-acetylglucosamine transferase